MDVLGMIFVVVVIAYAACIFKEPEVRRHDCKKTNRKLRIARGEKCVWCDEVVE